MWYDGIPGGGTIPELLEEYVTLAAPGKDEVATRCACVGLLEGETGTRFWVCVRQALLCRRSTILGLCDLWLLGQCLHRTDAVLPCLSYAFHTAALAPLTMTAACCVPATCFRRGVTRI